MRKRQCVDCGHKWYTVEVPVPSWVVGWAAEHERKPVLRMPIELRPSYMEAKDRIELLREAQRRRSEQADARHRRVKDCDSPDA